ncbi:MAG: YraN family protein [Woeseiaceae bacterium]
MERGRRRTLGARAEQLAFGYLLGRGLRPIARNFRCRGGEIDLMTFVEVRFRQSNAFTAPAPRSITASRQSSCVPPRCSRQETRASPTRRCVLTSLPSREAGAIRFAGTAMPFALMTQHSEPC